MDRITADATVLSGWQDATLYGSQNGCRHIDSTRLRIASTWQAA
jgi:hypothetical protein